MGFSGRFLPDRERRRSLLLSAALGVVALFAVVLSVLIVQVQAATNAYGGGESVWSRAQTNTTLNLLIYSETGEERFYRRALEWLEVNEGDKRARQIMEQPSMNREDWQLAREGLIAGQNHPDDVTRMIWLFRAFQNVPYFREAVEAWRETDPYVRRLGSLAQEMAKYHGHEDTDLERSRWVENRLEWQTELVETNIELNGLAAQFRDAMGSGSRVMTRALTVVSIVLLLTMGGLAVYLARELTLALTRSRRRYRSMVEQTSAGVARAARSGELLEVNEALCSMLRITPDTLMGLQYRDLVHPEDWRESKGEWLQFYRGQTPQLNLEQRFRRGDGEYVWLRLHVAPLDSDDHDEPEFVVVMEDVTENRALHDRLDHQASHDELTGLKNRRALRERIQQLIDEAQNHGGENALCFIDLDKFKVVNDTVGHEAGDHLLVQVTEKLRQSLRGSDFIARLGGDEFAVIFEGCPLDAGHYLAEKLRRALDGYPFRWDEHDFRISASVGVTSIDADCHSGDDVLRRADMACYVAKESGRNEVRTVHANDETIERRQMELSWAGRIRSAIEERRLWLEAQPFENVQSPNALRYEVLLRARDEQGQTIGPDAFIPAMERFGLIAQVDCWVIERVCEILSAQPKHMERLEACHINLSGRTFDDPLIAEWIVDTIERYRVPANKLCFEITETAAVRNFLDVNRFIEKLQSLGCRFALDDFGSGLSSFGYLRGLPVDLLKIDGVFVQTMSSDDTDRAMVEAITRIGQTLNKAIIAEFVEDEAAAKLLRKMGVDYLQGFHIARPQEFETYVRKTTR